MIGLASTIAVTTALVGFASHVIAGAVQRCQLDDSDGAGYGLACAEEVLGGIDVVAQYAANATDTQNKGAAGWYHSNICAGEYCVFSNKDLANGRGLSVITTAVNLQKIRRVQDRLDQPHVNRNAKHPPPFEMKNIKGQGLTIVANQTIRRGEALMALSPTLLIRKTFFDDVSTKEQESLLAAAFRLLPEQTRKLFQEQIRTADAGKSRALKDVILRHSFESDLGWATGGRTDELHYASYPEIAAFKHDCRPNVVFYIDGVHVHHTTVARKVEPGQELTIARLADLLLTQKDRSRAIKKWKKTECSCSVCSATDETTSKASDARIKEIKKIQAKLNDHESKGVTKEMIDRFMALYKQEHLETRLADAYELVATNYNYLGYSKEGKKYATLAAQAGSIEGGVDANNVIAMRILAKDPEGHYSYRMKVKR